MRMKFAVVTALLSGFAITSVAQAASLTSDTLAGVSNSSSVQLVRHRDDDEDRDHSRREGRRCGDPMSVVGAARITEGWARRLAVKAWKEQVRFRYGEEYMNYERAEVIKEQCEESSFGGSMKRCRIVAKPCKEVF